MNEPRSPHGPYDTEAEARADAAPLTAAIRAADAGLRPMTEEIRRARLEVRIRYLAHALVAAGVELGEYDRRIAAWLADWETETLQVVVGWIERAHAAGNVDANRAADLAALLVRVASASAQPARVRIEVTTVPGGSAASVADYAHDVAHLAAASATWGHHASPGRALWWAQVDMGGGA